MHSKRQLTRRTVLSAVPAVAALSILRPSLGRAADAVTDASRFPSLQAAIDATPDGGTVTTTRSAKTLGSAELKGRRGLTIRGLKINGRLTLSQCSNCIVTNCVITGREGLAIFLPFSTRCTVSLCRIESSGITAYGPADCIFDGNIINNPPGNGIGAVGYALNPAARNRYSNNEIRGCLRIGIEEYPAAGQPSCSGGVFQANRIHSPVHMGISAMGSNPTFIDNIIENPGWSGIETTATDTTVQGNTISHTAATATGVMINSTSPDVDTPSTLVSGNTITGMAVGISLIAKNSAAPIRNVTVSGNTVIDCADFGIRCEPDYEGGGLMVTSNVVNLVKPSGSSRNRYAIKTCTGLTLDGNSITYGPGSGGQSPDVPIHLSGNNVTLANSTVDGGGRDSSSKLLPSSALAPAGTYQGWSYLTNKHINGATINKSGTVVIADTDYP